MKKQWPNWCLFGLLAILPLWMSVVQAKTQSNNQICNIKSKTAKKCNIAQKTKIPIIIDTDAANDDWVAIMYLLSRNDIDIKAITVIGSGETSIAPGLKHVGDLTVLAGKQNIPIFSAPNRNTVVNYSPNHDFPISWQDGVNKGFNIPYLNSDNYKKANISKQPAANAIANIIKNSRSPINLVILGPLTNIDNAFKQLSTKDIQNIGKIYIMGGAYYRNGNLSKNAHPYYINNNRAEWNTFADPVALDEVFNKLDLAFSSSLAGHMTMVPLDTTQYFPVTFDYYKKVTAAHMKHPNNKILSLYYDIMTTNSTQDLIAKKELYRWDPLVALIAAMDLSGNLDNYSNMKKEIHGFWVATDNNYPECVGATIPIDRKNLGCYIANGKSPHGSIRVYLPSPQMVVDLPNELLSRITHYQ